jgi:molybdate transport system regulatory protein
VDARNRIVFGRGRMEILEQIEKTGSINRAAKMLKMSYKTAWSKIKSTEKHMQTKIVHSDKSKGTRLTQKGKELVQKYRLLNKKCMHADDELFRKIFSS